MAHDRLQTAAHGPALEGRGRVLGETGTPGLPDATAALVLQRLGLEPLAAEAGAVGF